MTQAIDQFVRAAGQAANAGRWEEAERLWREVAQAAPQHPQALFSLGVHALQRGDAAEAEQRLTQARAAAPQDKMVLLTLAVARRQRGDVEGDREAIDAALAVDAYFLPAMLAKAAWMERSGHSAAAVMYANCLKVAPPEPHWPEALRPQLQHAKQLVGARASALHAALSAEIADIAAQLPGALAERWREAVSIMAGVTTPYVQECNQLHVPRLPPIPFYERERFPWVAALEAKTEAIRAELGQALATESDEFNPYIAYRPGDPVNQWQELNHSKRWSAFQFYRGGQPVPEHLARCPETAAALAAVEMAEIGGLCPNAMFSALAPHTQIPPHTGETNARLVVHLPLIVPPRCTYRVGFERREWRVGEVLVFDDTLEHEARNDSDELRVVLIFDTWNPLLTPPERVLVQRLTVGVRAFGG